MQWLASEVLPCALHIYAEALERHLHNLNRLNVYPVADADTGTNMAMTMRAVLTEVDGLDPAADIGAVASAIVRGAVTGARGNSGVILSQLLKGLAGGLAASPVLEPNALALALADAARAGYEAVMRPVEGTILTVARESGAAAVAAAGAGKGNVEVLEAAADEGQASLARTPFLLDVLAAAGVVDAGGAGYCLLLEALAAVVGGRRLRLESEAGLELLPTARTVAGPRAPDQGGYEVMLQLDARPGVVERVKAAWSVLGDSIAVVEHEGTWTCHIHTADVAAVLAAVENSGGLPRQVRVSELELAGETPCMGEGEGPVAGYSRG